MLIRSYLLLVLLLPLGALAQCRSDGPESFATFIETFGRDKAFAVTRTEYPLTSLRYSPADNEKGSDVVTTRIGRADDAAAPQLGAIARADGLQLSTSSLTANTATVRMEKPDTDWLLTYHFVRNGLCWYLQRVEDHSL